MRAGETHGEHSWKRIFSRSLLNVKYVKTRCWFLLLKFLFHSHTISGILLTRFLGLTWFFSPMYCLWQKTHLEHLRSHFAGCRSLANQQIHVISDGANGGIHSKVTRSTSNQTPCHFWYQNKTNSLIIHHDFRWPEENSAVKICPFSGFSKTVRSHLNLNRRSP